MRLVRGAFIGVAALALIGAPTLFRWQRHKRTLEEANAITLQLSRLSALVAYDFRFESCPDTPPGTDSLVTQLEGRLAALEAPPLTLLDDSEITDLSRRDVRAGHLRHAKKMECFRERGELLDALAKQRR